MPTYTVIACESKMPACACVWVCPYRLAPAGREVSPLCLVSVNVSKGSQAWSCDRSADEPLLHPSPPASLPSAPRLNILYLPGITSGAQHLYLISGQNLSVSGSRANMHHSAGRCPEGTASVAHRISSDSGHLAGVAHLAESHGVTAVWAALTCGVNSYRNT